MKARIETFNPGFYLSQLWFVCYSARALLYCRREPSMLVIFCYLPAMDTLLGHFEVQFAGHLFQKAFLSFGD